MTNSIIVFHEQETLSVSEQSEELGSLVFYVPNPPVVSEGSVGEYDTLVLMDQPGLLASAVVLESDLIILSTPAPPRAVDFVTGNEVFEIVSGGPPGIPGPKGEPGETPQAYEQTFTYPIPSTEWVVVHGQGTKALSVHTFDHNEDPLVGDIEYTDMNTVTVRWFYPTAGSVIVFD